MSAHVLFKFIKRVGGKDDTTSLINSIIQEQEC